MSHRISTRYTAIFPFAHPFHQYFFHYLPVPRSLAFSPLPSLLLASFFSHGIPRHTAAICHPHENFLRAALRPLATHIPQFAFAFFAKSLGERTYNVELIYSSTL